MPIQLQIYHPDRMVIGIARGQITPQDLDGFVTELGEAKAFRYRKIIDVMGATSVLTREDLTAFSERIRDVLPERHSGPIAIVTNEAHSELSRLFAELTAGKRPAEVFRSIHEARRWLYENSRIV